MEYVVSILSLGATAIALAVYQLYVSIKAEREFLDQLRANPECKRWQRERLVLAKSQMEQLAATTLDHPARDYILSSLRQNSKAGDAYFQKLLRRVDTAI